MDSVTWPDAATVTITLPDGNRRWHASALTALHKNVASYMPDGF